MRIPNPDGTRGICPKCGHTTVTAELHGQRVDVHTGTWTNAGRRP